MAAVFLYLFSDLTWASPPKAFDIALESLPQAVPLNQETQIQMKINPAYEWQSGIVCVSIIAVTFVAPESNADSIVANPNIDFGSSDMSNGIVSVPLTIINNGEFEIRFSITLHTTKGDLNRVREVGVLAENGLAWFGRDSVSNAVRARIRHRISSDLSLSPAESEQKFRQEFEREVQERALRSRTNADLTARHPEAHPPTAPQ